MDFRLIIGIIALIIISFNMVNLSYATLALNKKSSVSIETWCDDDKFVHVSRSSGNTGACVKPVTADKLIKLKWAKPHSCVNISFVNSGYDTVSCYCHVDETLYTGGYYVTKNSTLIIAEKKTVQNKTYQNGYEVKFFNGDKSPQYAYVWTDCTSIK